MKFLKLTIFLFSIILVLGACSKDNGNNCEKGFTGENCDEPLTPTEMHVSKVTLTKFPPGKGVFGNLDWDLCDYPCSNPDIFVAFRQGLDMGESRTESETVHENCENGTDYVYLVDWVFEDAGATYSFGAYDLDQNEPLKWLLGYIIFIPVDESNGFPSQIVLTTIDEELSFTLDVTWEFD